MTTLRREILHFFGAETSASVASAIDFGLALGLTYGGLLPYQWANIIGVVMGGITNCTLNYRFVFRQNRRRKREVVWRYFIVWLGSMTINGLGTNTVTAIVGTPFFVVVKCSIALCVAVGFNYPLQRGWVFKGKKDGL